MKAELILFASLSLVAYVYVGYPAMLWLLGSLRERKTRRAPITPAASVIIAMHNEEAVIKHKLENTLSLDYPNEQLEIIVVSDGSTDGSDEIAARYAPEGVRLLRLARCGKVRALESAAAQARGDILVFTDANTWIMPHALRALIAHFADPNVGGVCGCKKVGRATASESMVPGEGFYWKYEQFLKKWESRTGSTIAADGALYAIRRELFHRCANPALADDFAISGYVPLQGKRLVLEPEAVVWEEPPISADSEFRRKVRVANHVIRSVCELRQALNPLRTGFHSVKLWSHKPLRYLVPIPLTAAWIASFFLAGGSVFYSLLLALQCGFYALALAGFLFRNHGLGCRPMLHTPFYFCMAHSAALMGAFSALRGKRIVSWTHQRSSSDLKPVRKYPG
ncbi:MAG: glycosyltransferase family 2 protein [Acidobacteria bacterium]|nr:glycosyltransferase family 2 protein [Acidobacteriota bacterium]